MKRYVVSVRTHLREQHIVTAKDMAEARDQFLGIRDFNDEDPGPIVSELEEYDIVDITEIPWNEKWVAPDA